MYLLVLHVLPKELKKSHVLQEMGGLSSLDIDGGAIRFCFSYENTIEDIDYTINVLKNSVEEIRKITMR